MRTTQRDKRTIWYALFDGEIEVVDNDGNYTGERTVSYSAPVQTRMNVSGGRGQAAMEQFGIDNPFTHTAVTGDLTTPFNTDTIFWFGITPGPTADAVPHNFRCTGVSRTVNQTVLALAEITVSNPEPIISA